MISAVAAAALALLGTPIQDAAAVYKKAVPSIMTIEVEKKDSTSIGTAFLIGERGLAATAYHVIDGGKSAMAFFSDGEKFEVSGVVDTDVARDIAIIRVKVADRPFLNFAEGNPEVGSKAFVIGAPRSLDFSISDGIIGQVRRLDSFTQYQYTCPTSPGNSGGPLLNDKGEVLGVVSWGLRDSQNLNFATAGIYAKGLDTSLATKPWTGEATAKVPAATDAEKAATAQKIFELRYQAFQQRFAMADANTLITRVGAGNIDVPQSVWTAMSELIEIAEKLSKIKTSDPKMNKAIIDSALAYLKWSESFSDVAEAIRIARSSGWNGLANSKWEMAFKKWQTPTGWTEVEPELKAWTPEAFLKQLHPDIFELYFSKKTEDILDKVGIDLDYRFHPSQRIAFVWTGTPAEKADIRPADTILTVDEKMMASYGELEKYFVDHRGRQVKIKVRRQKGSDATITLRVP